MATFRFNMFVLLFVFAILAPALMANIDDASYWQKRLEEANEIAQKTYEPDVFNITNKLNHEVHRVLTDLKPSMHLLESNDTRRQLWGFKKHNGPCLVTNPIDRCWRCQSDWHLNRKRLADCGLGFGYKTTGGKAGRFYVVTDNSDDIQNPKPGTLRWAAIQKEPLWITFERSMNIRLIEELMVQSHKTIDGRGVHVNIVNGAGITIQFQSNVIIHGIHIRNIFPGNGGLIRDAVDHMGQRTRSDGDGISLFGASNVWIDHVSMSKCSDGIIDIIEGSTGVTISNSHFTDHNEVMLFGAHDNNPKDTIMQITVAFNHFGKRLVQRMPRCRYGFVHVVNNDYTHWMMYAIGGSSHPTIISQGNRFIAPNDPNAKEITHRVEEPSEWQKWNWISEGDLMMNGAFFVASGDKSGAQKYISQLEKKAAIPAAKGTEVTTITKFAGSLACVPGLPC